MSSGFGARWYRLSPKKTYCVICGTRARRPYVVVRYRVRYQRYVVSVVVAVTAAVLSSIRFVRRRSVLVRVRRVSVSREFRNSRPVFLDVRPPPTGLINNNSDVFRGGSFFENFVRCDNDLPVDTGRLAAVLFHVTGAQQHNITRTQNRARVSRPFPDRFPVLHVPTRPPVHRSPGMMPGRRWILAASLLLAYTVHESHQVEERGESVS